MALNFDTKTAPVRPSELVALAEAVYGAGPADESVWLEWKSTLELSKKPGCHHIARAIVGFANRMPDVAVAHAEGRAYLVVGIAPGELPGVDPVDIVVLDQGLAPYLGKQPLRWRATYIPVTQGGCTAQVLIVEVDPPRWGDEIFCMCKEYDGVRDGTIFVRGNGFTLPATSHEVKALGLRQQRGTQEVEVELRVLAGTPLRPVNTGPEAAQQWLDGLRRKALASLPAEGRPAAASGRSYVSDARSEAELEYAVGKALSRAMGDLVRTKPETRTAEEYHAEVEEYLRQCAQAWPDLVVHGAAAHLAPLELELVNPLPANLAEVEVRLDISGDVQSVLPRPAMAREANELFLRLPRPPRPYGPEKVRSSVFDLPMGRYQTPIYPFLQEGLGLARPQIDNGGSTSITFPAVHLRPHERVRLDPVVVVVRAPAPAMLAGRWQSTSTSMDGRFVGELSIDVADEPMALAAVLSEPATWRRSESGER
ncbi:helix-turn-helix domain-containing protein [Nonomuraea endophytica]|uniref:helix-turn-helix domain-containing protein n=1 Tax=Nonomuraea endophytica TaxID=714136 RepID=UPI0037C66781